MRQKIILISYELLLYEILGSLEYHAKHLFEKLRKGDGEIEAHVASQALDYIFNEKYKDSQSIEATEAQMQRLRQILKFPKNYPERFVERKLQVTDEGLIRSELQLAYLLQSAHKLRIPVVCFDPSQHEQLCLNFKIDIDILSISTFFRTCETGPQFSVAEQLYLKNRLNLLLQSQSQIDSINRFQFTSYLEELLETNFSHKVFSEDVIPIFDAEELSVNANADLSLIENINQFSPAGDQQLKSSYEDKKRQHTHEVSSKGRTQPVSNRIRSLAPYNPSSDLLQILVFLFSQYWLIQLLQDQLKNVQSAELLSPEIAPPVNETGLVALLELIQSYGEPEPSVSNELEKNLASSGAVLGADFSEQIQFLLNLTKSAIAFDTFKAEKPKTFLSQDSSSDVNVPSLNETIDRQNNRQNNSIKFDKAEINLLNSEEGFLLVVDSPGSTKNILGADQLPLFNQEQSIDFDQSVLPLIEKPNKAQPDAVSDRPKTPNLDGNSIDFPGLQPQTPDSGSNSIDFPSLQPQDINPGANSSTPAGTESTGGTSIQPPGGSGGDDLRVTSPPAINPDPNDSSGENSSVIKSSDYGMGENFEESRLGLDSSLPQTQTNTGIQVPAPTGNSPSNSQNTVRDRLNPTDIYRPSGQAWDNELDEMNDDPVSGFSRDDQLCGGTGDAQLCGKDTNDNLIGSGKHSSTGSCSSTILKSGLEPNQFVLSSKSDATVIQGFCLEADQVILRDVSPCQISTRIDGGNTLLLFNNRVLATLQDIQSNTVPIIFE